MKTELDLIMYGVTGNVVERKPIAHVPASRLEMDAYAASLQTTVLKPHSGVWSVAIDGIFLGRPFRRLVRREVIR